MTDHRAREVVVEGTKQTPVVKAEIHRDMEPPEARRVTASGPRKYKHIADLEVGGAVIYTLPTRKELLDFRNRLSSTIHRYSKKYNRNYTTRTLERSPEGYRIGVYRLPLEEGEEQDTQSSPE